MAVETQSIEIRITTVDENSAATTKTVEENVDRLGTAGASSGEKVAAGMDKIKGHSLTALDSVRLLRDDIGIRIPRSMEKAIASSQALMSVIGAVGSGLLIVGAIDIGVRIVQGLHSVYEKFLDVDGVLQKFQDDARKAAEAKLFDEAGLQTQIAMIGDVNRQMDQLLEKKKQYSGTGNFLSSFLMGPGFDYFSPEDQKRLNEFTDQTDKAKISGIDKDHRTSVRRIEDEERVSIARAPQYARADVQKQFDYRRANEEQVFTDRRDRYLMSIVNRGRAPKDQQTVPMDDGWQENLAARETAESKAQASRIERSRTADQEIAHLSAQREQIGIGGIALLEKQRETADREWVRQHGQSAGVVQEIDRKFFAEESHMIEDQRRQTEELRAQAALPLFHGIGHTQAESDIAIGRIRADKTLDDPTKDARIEAEKMRAGVEIAEQQRRFSEETNSLADSSADHQIGAFARIRAEESRRLDEAKKKFDEVYGQINRAAPGGEEAYRNGVGLLQRREGFIGASTADQVSDLLRKNSEETSQLESQARAKLLSAEQQQTAAIATEYEQRLQKYKEARYAEVASGKLTKDDLLAVEEDYNRRVAAAAELRDAEMVENAKRAREKMAGEFTSFFRSLDHPTEAFKALGEKAAGQAAAAMVQRMQGHFGMGEQMPVGATVSGGLWDKLMSRVAGAPGASHVAAAYSTASDLASIKAITLATAEIHVQSATLSFSASGMTSPAAGGSAGITTGRGGPSAVPGTAIAGSSTSLLGMMGAGVSRGGDAGSSTGGFSSSTFNGAGSTGGGSGARGAVFGKGIGDVSRGIGLFNQAKGIFGSASVPGGSTTGGLGDTGIPDPTSIFGHSQTKVIGPGVNGGMLGGGGIMANAGGAAGGAMGLFSAYEGNGGIGGALGGAMSGMELGMAVGGPIGAAVGLVGGAILGAIGFGGREKARVYDLKTVRPRIANDMMAYQAGTMDYTSAYSDMQALDQESRKTLDAMGGAARGYYWDTINHEIKLAESKLTAEQRAGRSQFTATAAQYAIGTDSVPRDGFAFIHERERIMPSDQNERITRALEYVADSPRTMPVDTGFGGHVHFHISAIDNKGVEKFFMENGHQIRASINRSRLENSGGAES